MPNNKKHGIAILECPQEIPCNPCAAVCKTGAIQKANLNACPTLQAEKCIGCKLCVAACPGQAIFMQIANYDENNSTITFPYEYLPLPLVGQTVDATDRLGRTVCPAEVVEVDQKSSFNKTTLVTLKIPKCHRDDVRFMRRLAKEGARCEG